MKKRIFAVLAALILLFTACSSAPEVEYGPDVENPYPEVCAPPMADMIDVSPKEMLAEGDVSYVEGIVTKLNSPITKESKEEWFDVLLEKNPDAKLPDITYYSFDFSVERVLAGVKVPNEITISTAWETSIPEDLEIGQRFVIAVSPRKGVSGLYKLEHNTLAFYYISEENRVYPAGRMESATKYTGMTVDMFKDALNKKE